MNPLRLIVFFSSLVLLFLPGAMCLGRTVSADTLPREHWSYDAMVHLAAQGFGQGVAARFYQGDFLLDELQMARRVQSLITDREAQSRMSSQDLLLLSRLAQEFRNQLLFLGLPLDEIVSLEQLESGGVTTITGYVRSILRLTDDGSSLIGTYKTGLLAPAGRHGLVTATFTNADREYRANPQDYPRLSKLFYKAYGRSYEWEIGRDYLFWGPGYNGSMILSDNAPAFDFVRFQKDFSLGRRIGNIQITQVVSPFEDDGKHFWLLGRRWQKTFSSYFNFGANETVKTGKRPKPAVLIIPAFYWYQDIYLDDVDPEWNELISLDASYRTRAGNEFYGEVVIDDITAPRAISAGGKRPRKAGLLLGGYLPNLTKDGRTSARVELIIVDPETYLATRAEFPEMDYTRRGQFIGHPVGSDAEALFFRVTHRATGKLILAAEYLAARKRTNKERDDAANFLVLYNVDERLSASLRWRDFRGSSDERLEMAASFAF